MRNMPPGRAARLWLRRRLEITARGVDVLEEKTHALSGELRRLRQHLEETGRAWDRAWREADRWFLRAVALGGRQQFDLARSQVGATADARISWRSMMGVAYPAEVRLDGVDPADVAGGRSGALVLAARAHGRAVEAALDHAAAERALQLVEAELAQTRRRLRALDDRWMPRLRRTLREVELAIAENEREDMVRARWAARHGGRR